MRVQAEQYISEIAIVLIGNFNPVVFQPAWFSNQKILRSAEVDNANVGVIHPDVVSFSCDWLSLQVTRDRFTAITKSEPYGTHLRDFVVATFSKLEHTPIKQLGINSTHTISFANESDWHNFGHYFAPKSPWFPLSEPGMLQVNIRAKRYDQEEGNIHFSVEYAGKQKATMTFNDHFDLPGTKSKNGGSAEYFTNLISSNFEKSIAFAVDAREKIFEEFSQKGTFDAGRNETKV